MEKYIVITTGGNDVAYLVIVAGGYINWMDFTYTGEVRDFAKGKLQKVLDEQLELVHEILFRAQPDNKERFDSAEWYKL